MADADRLLELSRQAQGGLAEESVERQQIVAAAELLGQLLLQDVERAEGGVNLKDGVSRDRMMSVHDPEMRHGHKSSSKRFDGHKAGIVVDTDTQLITSVEVLPGNAPDNLGSLELVEAREANTGVKASPTDTASECRTCTDRVFYDGILDPQEPIVRDNRVHATAEYIRDAERLANAKA